MTIDDVIKKRRILITSGTGGVGKTTLSSALAIRSAEIGYRTLVITVDPAKRLATSLGVEKLGDAPTDLTPMICEKLPALKGTLHAIIPDTRATFESFIRSLSPNPQSADRIVSNPIFSVISREFSGANEFMALQRLSALERDSQWERIVLDTPPNRNTLALLNSSQVLADFFEEKLFQWLITPTHKLLSGGLNKALGLLEKLTGEGFMVDLVELARGIVEIQPRIAERLRAVHTLFQSDDLGFLMVAGPTPETQGELRHLIETLNARKYAFDGLILNRTLSYFSAPPEGPTWDLLRALQARERAVIKTLEPLIGRDRVFMRLPELVRDIHSIGDLVHVSRTWSA